MGRDGRDGGNIFEGVPAGPLPDEQVTELLAAPGLRIGRLVSTGQASPPGFWYDQDRAEWVPVLSGAAGLLLEGEGGRGPIVDIVCGAPSVPLPSRLVRQSVLFWKD